MRYFTRHRYDAIQTESPAAQQNWERAGREYADSLRLAHGRLPESASGLAKESFHDAIVEAVERPAARVVRVVLNAGRNPWGRRGRFALRFDGVVDASFREPNVGDWWLYEEVHSDAAGFAYDVLLNESEMHVEAFAVEIEGLLTAV